MFQLGSRGKCGSVSICSVPCDHRCHSFLKWRISRILKYVIPRKAHTQGIYRSTLTAKGGSYIMVARLCKNILGIHIICSSKVVQSFSIILYTTYFMYSNFAGRKLCEFCEQVQFQEISYISRNDALNMPNCETAFHDSHLMRVFLIFSLLFARQDIS